MAIANSGIIRTTLGPVAMAISAIAATATATSAIWRTLFGTAPEMNDPIKIIDDPRKNAAKQRAPSGGQAPSNLSIGKLNVRNGKLSVGKANTATTGGVNDVSGKIIVGGQLTTGSISGNVSGLVQEDLTINSLRAKKSVVAIGIAFAAQEIPAVPATERDARLDLVLTEREIIDFREH